jgi:hypothetical protein
MLNEGKTLNQGTLKGGSTELQNSIQLTSLSDICGKINKIVLMRQFTINDYPSMNIKTTAPEV